MVTWSSEITELSSLYKSFKGRFTDLDKEFERLIISDDANTVLLYSRRCLEVIVTDLCENELGRPRKTEPLKGVIDKLNKDEKVPAHIFTSMQNLNSVATFGAHPIEFNPLQVRSALIDLSTITSWFLEHKNIRQDDIERKDKTDFTLPAREDLLSSEKSDGKGKGKKGRNRLIWAGSLLVNIIFILVLIISLKPLPFSEEDWILITDFENLTGDDIFDQSLNAALEVSVQQSSFVNVFPRAKINETLKRMGKEKTQVIDEDTGVEIAEREGISLILACKISQIGNNYSLTASVVETETRKVLKTENFQANGKDEVLTSLDNLSRKIRRDLGESFKEINRAIVPLPEATTSSLEALKYFVRGLQAWSWDNQFKEAVKLFLKATELDPDFALAHAYLGSVYYWFNDRDRGEEYFKEALGLIDRLTEKEKLWIQARVEEFRGNYDEAVVKYNIYLKNYSSASEGWFHLGYSHMRLKHFEDAIIAFEKSLQFYKDKDPNTYINLATCYSALEKYPQAVEYYIKGFDSNPTLLTVPNINNEFGFTYVNMGEIQKAMEVFEKLLTGTDANKARGYRSQALLLMYQGKYREAIEILHKSIIINKSLGFAVSELRDHLFLASAFKIKRMIPEFSSEMNKANILLETAGMEPWWFFIYGKMLIRDGEKQKAETILNEISERINEGNRSDQAAFNVLKGEIELSKGNFTEALELFETALNLRYDNYILESLANYYYARGESDLAILKYKEISSNKNQLGWEAQDYWIMAHYFLGKIYEKKGENDMAIKYYQDFLNIWKDADYDLGELTDSREAIKKLQSDTL